MADTPISLAYPAANGISMTDEPVVFTGTMSGKFLQSTVNLRIQSNRWRTAFRTVEYAVTGEDAVVAEWQKLQTQQAIWYLPRSGQGTHYIGVGPNLIVETCGGKMFTLEPRQGQFQVKDVSGGVTASKTIMMAWLCQAENYVFRTDGSSQTQIWDGKSDVQLSPGYNSNVKTRARIPNAAGPMVYAGGQVWIVLFDRRIYVSDSLHEQDLIGATDLLKFIDQTYDYINVYFAPPTDDGNILALTTSINSGYQDSRAQGEVLAMCDGPSIWAVTLGIPRTSWPSTQMRHSRSVEAAAAGPNAFFVRDGDIIMRTTRGIESINLLAREITTLGNPALNLGADLNPLLMSDYEPDLIFASLVNPPAWDRMMCTVTPVINGPRHYHMGWISANWNPINQRLPSGFSWEGINTLPYDMGRVIQFLFARIEGKSRLFSILDKGEGQGKGLCEHTLEEGHNILADGSWEPIQWQMLTKRLMPGGDFQTAGWKAGWLWLDNIQTEVNVQIYARSNISPDFKLLRQFHVEPLAPPDALACGCSANAEKLINLGNAFSEYTKCQWLQILVKGDGVCTIDIGLAPVLPDSADMEASDEVLCAETVPICQYDPFEYAKPQNAEIACSP